MVAHQNENSMKQPEFQLPPIPEHFHDDFDALFNHITGPTIQSNVDRVKAMYSFMDRYAEFVKTFTVCAKGCSHCCKIPLDVTQLEISVIEESIGLKADYPKGNDRIDPNDPCPLLNSDGSCSVYEHRPLSCRTLATIDDPKFCERREKHHVYGSGSAEITSDQPFEFGVSFYHYIYKYITELNEGCARDGDIRDFFSKH